MNKPPVPADADLRDFAFMPLDVVRLTDSDLTAISTGDEFKASVLLWCKAWHQVPASSLPNDDRMLAHLAGYGRDIKGWKKVKDAAVRGFVLCDDGRLYHPVIAEKVIEAIEAKRKRRERTAAATKARQERNDGRDDPPSGNRDDQRNVPRDDQRNEDRNVHQGTGTGTGTVRDEVVARARDPDADLEHRLRQAAGWQNEPSPKLAITGPIQALIDAGADIEQDVLPVIQAIAPQADGRSWNYFVKAIARARDQRISASTVVSMNISTPRSAHAARPQKPSRDETFAAIRHRIDEIAVAEADSGAACDGDGSLADPVEGAA